MGQTVQPTQNEVFFPVEEIIVSKTDVKGRITYANSTFCHVAGYTEHELLGEPHSIIRHPDMPRAVFKLLWDELAEGREVFAYVKNLARNGDFYWVFAHVTPSFDAQRQLVGYHSSRRVPLRSAIETIAPVYAQLLGIEQSHRNAKEGLAASFKALQQTIAQIGMPYEQFVLSLGVQKAA